MQPGSAVEYCSSPGCSSTIQPERMPALGDPLLLAQGTRVQMADQIMSVIFIDTPRAVDIGRLRSDD
jgi:hypothetical protein